MSELKVDIIVHPYYYEFPNIFFENSSKLSQKITEVVAEFLWILVQ